MVETSLPRKVLEKLLYIVLFGRPFFLAFFFGFIQSGYASTRSDTVRNGAKALYRELQRRVLSVTDLDAWTFKTITPIQAIAVISHIFSIDMNGESAGDW